MKLAFLLTQLEVGGAQVRVMQTAAELRRRGHDVDVLYLYAKRACFEDEPKIVLGGTGRPGPSGLIRILARLYRVLRNGRYDAIVTNTAPANLIGNSVAAISGIDNRNAVQTQPPERLSPLLRLGDRIAGMLGIYTRSIANSGWTHSCFENYPGAYRRRLHLVHNGLTPRTSSLTKREARARLGLDPDAFLVVNIGRLSVQKDHATLIRAMEGVPGTLLVAGDGELKDELEALVRSIGLSERVRFLGEIGGEEIAMLLRAGDVFAFSSRWETFGLALLEAAASGVPLVVTDLDVLREVLGSGADVARFVEPGNSEAFTSALNAVREDPILQERMRGASYDRASFFSIQSHVGKLVDLLKDRG